MGLEVLQPFFLSPTHSTASDPSVAECGKAWARLDRRVWRGEGEWRAFEAENGRFAFFFLFRVRWVLAGALRLTLL